MYEDIDTVQGIFDALSPTVNAGVVPQENSIFGIVNETYDGLRDAGFVRGEVTLGVQHCLLARHGVQVEDIKEILSHEQALGQCRRFIDTHFPSASLVKTSSTAAAARALQDGSPNRAAICSRVCADLFGLRVLRRGIQDEAANFTRFYVIAKSNDDPIPNSFLNPPSSYKALVKIVQPIASLDTKNFAISQSLDALQIVFTRIDRRPSRTGPVSSDIYFVELQGPAHRDPTPPAAWFAEATKAVQRVKEAGGEAQLIGLW